MPRPLEVRKCHVCRQRSLRRVIEPYEETIFHDGRTVTIRVPDLELIKCVNPDCHPEDPSETMSLDDDAVRRFDRETYRQLGLLTPEEIRHERDKLGLTQQELQDRLRLGGNSLSRWESGAVFQSRSLDMLLRIVFGKTKVAELLEEGEGKRLTSQVGEPA